jgi:lipoyl(octanoyl) transferase
MRPEGLAPAGCPSHQPLFESNRLVGQPLLASLTAVRAGNVLNLGLVPYLEAWDLQRKVAAQVAEGSLPDTVLLLEHPPVITLGRRTEPGELHVPPGAEVEIIETDRGGKSTYHGPGQLVCYPIFDLNRHGLDVKKYCRDLEEALIRTLEPFGIEATRIDGLTGIWLERPPRKIASIGIHISNWITTHGYALNVDLDPAPFTEWITACGLDAQFTTMARELDRPVSVDELRPVALAALGDVFDLTFDGAGPDSLDQRVDDPRVELSAPNPA